MTLELFDNPPIWQESLAPGATVLRGLALGHEATLLQAIERVTTQAPFRNMVTPGGHSMSAAMSNCGALGWVTDQRGYRYTTHDPVSSAPWPAMPDVLSSLAADAAAQAGYSHFVPDACLINRYQPGAKMGLHQDKNEQDFDQPIVSVSLGLPVTFQFGGLRRCDKPVRVPLTHGDVVVWGGDARLRYHGVLALKTGTHPQLGACRINLTLRKAG